MSRQTPGELGRQLSDPVLAAHDPFGAAVVGRDRNLLAMNVCAQRLLAWSMRGPPAARQGDDGEPQLSTALRRLSGDGGAHPPRLTLPPIG